MSKTMIIIRGIPGSGKSTVADALAEQIDNCIVCEADDYFYDEDNNYKYNGAHIKAAHEWCYEKAYHGCLEGLSVIVSNTSTLAEHVQKYIDLAKDFGYNIQVITCQSTFDNIHGVPPESMDKMKRSMCYKHFDLGC